MLCNFRPNKGVATRLLMSGISGSWSILVKDYYSHKIVNSRVSFLWLNWHTFRRIYSLTLHYQILFTKIDEEPF